MESGRVIRRADPTSIQNKVIVGYQGWFTCPGDGLPVHQGHHGWLHWLDKPLTEGGRPNFDLFPDVTEYSEEELYPVPGLALPSSNRQYNTPGQPAKLFSSRNPKTVQRHFHWMAQHGIDGAFLQRFASQCEVDGNTVGATADLMRLRDEVLDRVREAAERDHRVWAIMYDVSSVPADRVEHVLRVDWEHLLRDKRILDSPYYLRERGMPVVAIWGFGFVEARHDPSTVARIAQRFKSTTPGGAYLWAGVPSQWRTSSGDMDPNPVFRDVFKNEFDALSPWTIGRYSTLDEIDRFCEERMQGDFKELKDLPHRVDYFPTIWPGGSANNLSEGRMALNDSPRQGGKFFWRQLWNAKHLGARSAYIAMFDEYDEGTAILPAIPLKRSLPVCTDPNRQFLFIALDADGIDNLSPDWYLRICGFAGEAMRDGRRVFEELPKKELDDYWATRPKYENPAAAGGSGSGSGYAAAASAPASSAATSNSQQPNNAGGETTTPRPPVRQSTGAWGAFGDDNGDDGPPPYTLEAIEESESNSSATSAAAPAPTPVVPTTVHNVQPAQSTPPVAASGGLNNQSSMPGSGVHRASSYTGPSNSNTHAQNQSQGATGLGRSTTYSPTTTNNPAPTSRPTFAPPSVPPPNRTGSPLYPPARPPVHPSSPLATPGIQSSPSSSESSLPYLQYHGRRPGTSTPNGPPTSTVPSTGYISGSASPAAYNTPPVAQNIPLPGHSSPNHGTAPLPGGFMINMGNSNNRPQSGYSSGYSIGQAAMGQSPVPPKTGGAAPYDPATMSYNPASGQSSWNSPALPTTGAAPYDPKTMSYNPAASQPTGAGHSPAQPTAPYDPVTMSYNPASGKNTSPVPPTTAAAPYDPATMSYNPASGKNTSSVLPMTGAVAPYDPATMSYNPASGKNTSPVPPMTGTAPYNPATMSYNPASGSSTWNTANSQSTGTNHSPALPTTGAAPYDPATMSYNPASSQSPWNPTTSQSPGLTGGYFNAGTNASYGAGNASGAQSSGVVSNPTWSTNTQPSSAWNTPSAYPTPQPPNPTPGFAPPMHAPPSGPPSSSSSYPGGPPGTPSFPPQEWNSPYSAPGSNSGPPTPFGGAGYHSPAQSGSYNAPPLPPRPGEGPGGFVAPAQNTFLGGFVKQASGVVDRYAGENTRIQLEKGVMSVAETGSSLLGKLTKKPK